MLDEELERGFSIRAIKRKALTRSVIGRFDLSMPPLVPPPHAGGCLKHCVLCALCGENPSGCGGWLPTVLFFCHPFLLHRTPVDAGG